MSAVPETKPAARRQRKPITAERFLTYRYERGHELVAGRVVKLSDNDALHGSTAYRVARIVGDFVDLYQLGQMLICDTGFALDPLTVRKPDVAFVPRAQWKEPPEPDWWPGAPPLAIEVASKSDPLSELEAKARKYLAAGSREVWIVSPFSRTVQVWRAGEQPFLVAGDARLESPALLPGITVPVSRFFVSYQAG